MSYRSSGSKDDFQHEAAAPPSVEWFNQDGTRSSELIPEEGWVEEDPTQPGQLRKVTENWDLENPQEEESWADPSQVEEVRAFHEASERGRFLDAHRELERLRAAGINPSEVLGVVPVERVSRIYSTYSSSLQMMNARMEEFQVFERNDKLGVKWGFEFKDSCIRILYEAVYAELDVVRTFAAVQERDLHKPFSKGLVSAEVLGEVTPHDTIWQSFNVSKSTNTQNDNVTHISGMDALDEPPLTGLWSGSYTMTAETSAILEVPIPPVREGHNRSEHVLMVHSIRPLVQPGQGDRCRGLRMKVLADTKLPSVVSAILSMMPSWALKRLARSKIEAMPMQFKDFVCTSKELDHRMAHGPRRDFYALLRDRLVESSQA